MQIDRARLAPEHGIVRTRKLRQQYRDRHRGTEQDTGQHADEYHGRHGRDRDPCGLAVQFPQAAYSGEIDQAETGVD